MIYRDIYDGPPRSYIRERTGKRWIVIHSTQNDASAEGEASYAKRRRDGISSHYYIDGNSIVQSLDTDLGAHHVGSSIGNRGGISYELTGFAAWSRDRWLNSIAWPLLAAAIARDCAEHNIAVRELSVAQIKNGATGIITHNQARLAWGHTTHTDPGPNFPMDHLVRQVQRALEGDMAVEVDLIGSRVKMADDDGNRWSFGRILGKDSITANAALGYAAGGGWQTRTEVVPMLKALTAAVAGDDVAAAASDAARQAVRDGFADLGPMLAAELSEVAAERVEQALRNVLGSLDEGGA